MLRTTPRRPARDMRRGNYIIDADPEALPGPAAAHMQYCSRLRQLLGWRTLVSVKITIGIPTFNGAQYISGAIESVLGSITPELLGRVDILVSDNNSTDGTAAICGPYVEANPGTVYLQCHDENLGFDRNVQSIFEAARGEYVVILGDDDLLATGALERLVNLLDGDPDLSVVVGYVEFWDIATGGRIQNAAFPEDRRFASGDDFFRATKWGTAAVSSLVIRRTSWLEQDLASYVGSQWIHVAAVMKILAQNGCAYALASDFATVRMGNPRWSINNGNQLYLGMKHLELISQLTSLGYQPQTFAWYLEDRYRTNRRDVYSLRARRARENMPTARLMIRYFRGRPRFWRADLPLLLMPGPVFRTGRRSVELALAARRWLLRTVSARG